MLSVAEKFLIDFHAAYAGATAEAFGALTVVCRGQEFPSSYEVLAAAVPTHGQRPTVLDLGCGSGFLLELLANRRQAGLELLGIDMSAAELEVAARALGGRALLVKAMGQALPAATNSIDIILSHMVLMLMDDVDTVMAETARVLKPGGTFAAVVGGATPPSIAFTTYIRILERYRKGAPERVVRFGDARFRNEEGIRALFAPRYRDVVVDEIHLNRRLTPAGMWAWFMRMYDLHQLAQDDRAAIESEYLSSVTPLCGPDGMLDFPQMLRCVQGQAS
jgi:SAM-dependent methyltransferase